MTQLTKHIQKLLLENDIAIIPHFGGFLTHYAPAVIDAEKNFFAPPKRTIGFNQQLKLNDGLLIQSYMNAQNITFQEAEIQMKSDINQLKKDLEENGSFRLNEIGTIFCNPNGQYTFKEDQDLSEFPIFFGMESFEMPQIKELQCTASKTQTVKGNGTANIRYAIPDLVGAIAVIMVIIASFFVFSPSVEDQINVSDENLAKILPLKIWDINVDNSHNIATKAQAPQTKTTSEELEPSEQLNTEIELVESTTPNEEDTPTTEPEQALEEIIVAKNYHIIVASLIPKNKAQLYVKQLQNKNYQEAQVLTNDRKTRVSVASFETIEAAQASLNNPTFRADFPEAWILKIK